MLDKEKFEQIKDLILKHPFFRNPNHYHIRMITIMKYLKKKNVDVEDEVLLKSLDKILLSIDGVKKDIMQRYSYKKG